MWPWPRKYVAAVSILSIVAFAAICFMDDDTAALAQAPAATTPLFGGDQPTFDPYPIAVLQGLDKITARVWTFEVAVGRRVTFGTLDLQVLACRKRPPEEPPESAGFLAINDQRRDGSSVEAFRGWMFASSPALSSLQHAVYDIWLLDCVNAAPPAPGANKRNR